MRVSDDRVSFSTKDQKLAWDEDGNLVIAAMDRLGYKLFDGSGKLVGVDAGLVKIEVVIDIGDPTDPEDDAEVSFDMTADTASAPSVNATSVRTS